MVICRHRNSVRWDRLLRSPVAVPIVAEACNLIGTKNSIPSERRNLTHWLAVLSPCFNGAAELLIPKVTERGLYCRLRDLYTDRCQGVSRAFITHAHGNDAVWAPLPNGGRRVRLLQARLGPYSNHRVVGEPLQRYPEGAQDSLVLGPCPPRYQTSKARCLLLFTSNGVVSRARFCSSF
jgi:hypothetical protein